MPVFAATEKETVPFPEPLPPPEIIIHESLLAAVQLQPVAVMTLKTPLPPPAEMLALVADNAYVQPAA